MNKYFECYNELEISWQVSRHLENSKRLISRRIRTNFIELYLYIDISTMSDVVKLTIIPSSLFVFNLEN